MNKIIQIRKNVFETNSSSTHTITVVPFDYDNYYILDGEVINKNEIGREYNNCCEYILSTHGYKTIQDLIDSGVVDIEYIPLTVDQYIDNIPDFLETTIDEYTTLSGDKIKIISSYGFDS